MGQFLDIAETVLRKEEAPLKPRQIVDRAKDEGLFSDKLSGKTPAQTMKAKLTVDVIKRGPSSRFVRTGPNTFYLRELLGETQPTYTAARQTPAGSDERVITIAGEVVDRAGRFQGINRAWRTYLDVFLKGDHCQPVDRMIAEQDESRKQLLTYILVTHGSRLLCFRRGTFNRVEDFLRGTLCVGFGGHVSESDRTLYNLGDLRSIILDNASRELSEELTLPRPDRERLSAGIGMRILGLLNDDSSSTGRKHLAVVLQYEISDAAGWDPPQKGEKSINQLTWLDLNNFRETLRDFEYWSQLCLAEFFKKAIRNEPSFRIRRRAPFMHSHILCIIGGIGSGKSAATDILTKEFGYTEINSGQVVAKLLGIQPVPLTPRGEFQRKAWKFIHSKRGPKRLASALIKEAKQSEHPALIDGIRQKETIENLRALAAPIKVALLYVYTPPHISYDFYQDRSGEQLSLETFLRLYNSPVESDVKKLIADADAILYNWTGKLSYERAVRLLMQELHK
jgi:predicted NUDIX family phosphoesterase/dephospho-CoA kinase